MFKRIISFGAVYQQKTIRSRYPIRAAMATDNSCESEIKLYEFADLQKALGEKDKQPLNLIDVREKSEIEETGMVPGAVHVPLGQVESALDSSEEEFKQKYKSIKPKQDDPVVFMCKAGRRSYEAARIAVRKNYTEVGSYKYGFLEWAEKAKELENK